MRTSAFKLLLVLLLAACSCSGQHGMRAGAVESDTVTVAVLQKGYTLGSESPLIQMDIPVSGSKLVSGAKYYLTLARISMPEAPDGVYELYVTGEPLPVEKLQPEVPGFVTVLDTYMLTSLSGKSDISLDISQAINGLSVKNERGSLWLSILFRGNIQSTGGASSRAGRLSFERVKLMKLR